MSSSGARYQLRISTDMTVDALLRDYAHLTFPPLSKRVQGQPIPEPLTAVAAVPAGQTRFCALALAHHHAHDTAATVLSLFVEPAQRRQGVGSALLARLKDVLSGQGRSRVQLSYRDDWPGAVALERILARQGWEPPRDHLLLAKARPEVLLQAPWFARARLAEGYTVFPWTTLPAAERQIIAERQAREAWFSPELSPFQEEARLEPASSLGLRWHSELVGWMITHRINAETVQYTSLFITPQRRHRSQAVPLLAAALRRHAAQRIPFGIFQVDVTNAAMQRFLERRLRASLLSLTTARRAATLVVSQK